jgi:hypothetical protein
MPPESSKFSQTLKGNPMPSVHLEKSQPPPNHAPCHAPLNELKAIQFLRSTLLLGSIFMAFGFLVVFIPAEGNRYVPTSSFGKAVVIAFQTPWMRMLALSAYTFMVSAQIAVAGSLYIVTTSVLELSETDAIGISILYVLFAAFYLMAFASSMLKKKFLINGEYLVDNLREGAAKMLEHPRYKYGYIVFHVMVCWSLCFALTRNVFQCVIRHAFSLAFLAFSFE